MQNKSFWIVNKLSTALDVDLSVCKVKNNPQIIKCLCDTNKGLFPPIVIYLLINQLSIQFSAFQSDVVEFLNEM